VVKYFADLSISIARSFVIDPLSTVSTQTFSKVEANLINSSLLSNLPLWASPLVQARI